MNNRKKTKMRNRNRIAHRRQSLARRVLTSSENTALLKKWANGIVVFAASGLFSAVIDGKWLNAAVWALAMMVAAVALLFSNRKK